jgi:transposase-like protein
MGRRGYPAEFRRRVLDLVNSGRKVADVARDLGVSDQAIYNWRRQDRIDGGLKPGTTSAELAGLTVAKKRIRELEVEVAIHRRVTEQLKEHADPKGRRGPAITPSGCRRSTPTAART